MTKKSKRKVKTRLCTVKEAAALNFAAYGMDRAYAIENLNTVADNIRTTGAYVIALLGSDKDRVARMIRVVPNEELEILWEDIQRTQKDLESLQAMFCAAEARLLVAGSTVMMEPRKAA